MVVFDGHEYLTEEERRLKEDRQRTKYWKKWGPYVAERQWATGVFEDTQKTIWCDLSKIFRSYFFLLQFAKITAPMVMHGVVRSRSPYNAARSISNNTVRFPA